MARMPARLKRPIIPVWNAVYRLAYRASLYADAIRHRRFETCVVCGGFGPMLYQPRVIPARLAELWGLTPPLAAALARKESCDCSWCGAKLRARRLAQVLLETFPPDNSPRPARTLAQWVKHPANQSLRIAEINRIDGLHDQLLRLPHFTASDFVPGAVPGTVVHGARSEDLAALTYDDQSFDLVLTSETLEHVPDLNAALSEIRRVLVPGGFHLFTIPVLPGVPETFARVAVRADETLEYVVPPIHHPGGDVGYLVFTEFGADLPDLFRKAGFVLDVRFGPISEYDIAQVYVARKV